MKVHDISLRITGTPEGIQYLSQMLEQLTGFQMVESSSLYPNRNSSLFCRKYLKVYLKENGEDGNEE